LDEARQGCIPLVKKEYVNPHSQKQEIPNNIEPGDRLGPGRSAETPAGNIQPPDKTNPYSHGEDSQHPGHHQGPSRYHEPHEKAGTNHHLYPGNTDGQGVDHPTRKDMIIVQGVGEARGGLAAFTPQHTERALPGPPARQGGTAVLWLIPIMDLISTCGDRQTW